jgi:protein phosphatase
VTDVAAVTDRGRVREANEDRYLTKRSDGVTLLAVADGVGGEAGGDVASAAAVDALASSFDFAARDTASALASAMRAANDAVLRATAEHGHHTAASTLVAAAVRGRQIAVANLGDSRAYLVRGRAARQITTDHAGELANSITRFVGDPRGISPDVFVEIARPRDRLVLCSDGLTKHVAPEEIGAAAGATPERAARSLVELANARGGQDNVTVVVYASPLLIGRTVALVLLALLVLIALAGSAGALLAVPSAPPPASPSPSPSPSPTMSPSPSPTPSPGPTESPPATPSPSPSP